MKLKVAILCLAFIICSVFPVGTASYGAERDLPSIFEELDIKGPEKNTVEELEQYIRSHAFGESVDEALLRLARIHAQGKDTNKAIDTYQKLLEQFPDSRFKFDALYELGTLRYKTGKLKDAKSLVSAVSASRDVTVGLRAKAARLLKEIESASNGSILNTPAIGVLLPLKGNYNQFGEDALSGVLLAADVFGDRNGSVEVIVKNVGADPSTVEGTVAELSANNRVAGIVGPLLSSTAFETARQAQKKGIPVITLSQKDGLPEVGDYVFRNFLTPRQQASGLAEYAVKKLGNKRIVMLYPQSNYGIELAKLFEKEVKRYGGEVVKQVQYAQGATDFSEEMKRAFAVQVKERKEGRKRVKEFTPTLKADALFIPDSYEAVNLITPYLDYYGIKDIQLLGSNGWNSPKLVEAGAKGVEGAIFVDGFYADSSREGTEEFTGRFKQVYGRAPGVLEAQAYDAARILILAANGENNEMPDRLAVKNKLHQIKNFNGASGNLRFDGNGEAVKNLFILTVKDGQITEAPNK
ncbi:MAG: penicillin-binding protein activator [Deltaproteobacteria bacterium]|nr:penicillin-binding protein activator [Deltaproteobacteria bacterium]